jgi:hypothetical protein
MILGGIICYCDYKLKIDKEKNKKFFNIKILLLLSIVIYQGLQLLLNIRIYFLSLTIKKGINYKHFINKIVEHIYGYIIMNCLLKIKNYKIKTL